jgi:hypothetical protein
MDQPRRPRPPHQVEGFPHQVEGFPHQVEGKPFRGLVPQGFRWPRLHLYHLYHPKGYSTPPFGVVLYYKTALAGRPGAPAALAFPSDGLPC